MSIYKQQAKLISIASIFIALLSQSVLAHESRIISNENGDQLRVTAGNQPEPVFAGQLTRTDLFLNQVDSEGNFIPVDVSTGASIENLKAYVLYLKEDIHVNSLEDPLVLKSMKLEDIGQARGTENRYQTPIIYSKPGAYGFYYRGTVITNDGTEFLIDEFFVCRGGSLAEPRDDGSIPSFGCVEEPVVFPGKMKKNKKHDDKFKAKLRNYLYNYIK